jgi:predicted deacetylase
MAKLIGNNGKEDATAIDRAGENSGEDCGKGHLALVNEIRIPTGQRQQHPEKHNTVFNKNNEGLFAIVTIHDVSPEYSEKIFRIADELEKLDIHYNLAIIPYLKKRTDNLINKNPDFVKSVLGYEQEIVLHGNYHETDDGKIEDFHTFSAQEAKKHLQNAMGVLKDAGINTTVFVPPTWAINKPTIDDLVQLGFKIVEGKEEVLILDHKDTMRLNAGVLNWDQSGSPQKNKEYLTKNKFLYELEVMQKKSRLIRIAIHPKDPEEALQDQIEIIQDLKEKNYSFISYGEMIRINRGEQIQKEQPQQQQLQQRLMHQNLVGSI